MSYFRSWIGGAAFTSKINYLPKKPTWKEILNGVIKTVIRKEEIIPCPDFIEDVYGNKYRTNSESEMLAWVRNEDNPENNYNELIPEYFRTDINFVRKAIFESGYIYSELPEEFKNDRGCFISLLNSCEAWQMCSHAPIELQNDFTVYLEANAAQLSFTWLETDQVEGKTNPLFKEFEETGMDWTRKNMQSFYLKKTLEIKLHKKEKHPRRQKI